MVNLRFQKIYYTCFICNNKIQTTLGKVVRQESAVCFNCKRTIILDLKSSAHFYHSPYSKDFHVPIDFNNDFQNRLN